MSKKNLYTTYNNLIKVVLTIVCLVFLYNQLFVKQNLSDLQVVIFHIFKSHNLLFLFVLSLILMPVNWLLEAIKWKYLLKKQEYISVFTALKAVFCGASVSAITPNRTGDYFGRIFILKKTGFWDSILITLIGSFAQTITTLFFGGVAFYILFTRRFNNNSLIINYNIIFWVFFIILFLAILFYFKISLLERLPKRWQKIHKYVQVFKEYNFVELSVTLGLSIARYFVFSIQYYFIFKAVEISGLNIIEGFCIISTLFLINTIRPSIALLEIGIRGSISISIFTSYYNTSLSSNYEARIFAASTIIWLINIILPALIGLIFIKDLKFFRIKKLNK